MRGKKRSNPLRHRIIHELQDDWRKYIVIALFLIFIIGCISGMYVANGSMLKAGDEAADKYRREDGHFTLSNAAADELIDALEEKESVTVYENLYREQKEEPKTSGKAGEKLTKKQKRNMKIRIFKVRSDINKASVLKGRLPENGNEIAVDRMHAENIGLTVGDTLKAGDTRYEVTGLVSNCDYTTLFENSTDMMFDALTFDVGLVTEKGFDRLKAQIHESYAYIHTTEAGNGVPDRAGDEEKERKRAEDFVKTLAKEAAVRGNSIESFVPAYANQAIQFALDDFGSDKAMGGVILYVLVAVLAFVFAVTISSMITKDSMVIGTLRASGYSRTELVRHYMVTPIIVTLIAAIIGNILGYTVFKNIVVGMYYNSYSLPSYETIPSSEAFVKTTVVPIILMFIINLIVIAKKMQHTPLQFLRRELKKQRKGRALRLPGFRFISRFRLRVILQNIPGYFILFIGICCVMIMMAMAVGMPDSLEYYQEKAPDLILAKHQVILKDYRDETGSILGTDEESAEPFAMQMMVRRSDKHDEDIEAYGIAENSRYIKSGHLGRLKSDEVLVSSTYAAKFGAKEGDKIKLTKKYTDEDYQFKVAGIYRYEAGSSVFMPIDSLRETFDMDAEAFGGWFCDKRPEDIKDRYILNDITADSVRKIVDQLDHSFGSYMLYFQFICVALSVVLIFLLTKLIIERNENAISMTKILGYTNREISSIYLASTTLVVIVSDIAAVFIGYGAMNLLWRLIMERMDGWFDFIITQAGLVRMFLFVFVGYLIVMFFDYRRICRVPMDEALKMME